MEVKKIKRTCHNQCGKLTSLASSLVRTGELRPQLARKTKVALYAYRIDPFSRRYGVWEIYAPHRRSDMARFVSSKYAERFGYTIRVSCQTCGPYKQALQ